MRRVRQVFVLFILLGVSRAAFAQGQFVDGLYAGECRVRFQVPPGTDTSTITLNILADIVGGRLRELKENANGITLEYRLQTPLAAHETVEVTYAGGGSIVQAVGAPRRRNISLDDCPRWDERTDFEAQGFAGEAADGFAPNSTGDYQDGTSYASKTRFIAGVEAQYRILGEQGGQYQLWVRGRTLYGVRSADVDCTATPTPPVCGANYNPDSFKFTVLRASSLETYVEPRLEFYTLKKDRSVPATLFAFARFGFVDLPGAPKVFEGDSIGLGARVPKGVFRESEIETAWGRTSLFASGDAKWNRMKINATLIFNILPAFSEQLKFWNALGSTMRGFISMSIDRNPEGPGPEAVQSYIGIAFDVRQLHF